MDTIAYRSWNKRLITMKPQYEAEQAALLSDCHRCNLCDMWQDEESMAYDQQEEKYYCENCAEKENICYLCGKEKKTGEYHVGKECFNPPLEP